MRALKILSLSVAAAFACAAAYIMVIHFSLPSSDEANGMPLWEVFSDPFVLSVAIPWAFFLGFVSFPFAYLALRNLRLVTSASFVFLVMLAEIAIVTPFSPSSALLGSVPTLALALLVCRFSGWRIFAYKTPNAT